MARRRQSVRLPAWDYRTAGAYFVTMCTYSRECFLDDAVIRAALEQTWRVIGKYARGARGDDFIVMPNHVHGIVWLPGVAPRGVGARHVEVKGVNPTTGRHLDSGSTRLSLRASPLPSGDERPYVCERKGSLGAIVGGFKSAAAKRINRVRNTPQRPVWQRGYHERIIRDDEHLQRAREYIRDNPAKWALDPNNPEVYLPTAKTGRSAPS